MTADPPSGHPQPTSTTGLDGAAYPTAAEAGLERRPVAAHRVGWGFISRHAEPEPADGHADQEPGEAAGDGEHEQRRDPAGAVVAALELVERFPEAGLPPAHVGPTCRGR
jgi:hypothetical protein